MAGPRGHHRFWVDSKGRLMISTFVGGIGRGRNLHAKDAKLSHRLSALGRARG